MKSYSKKLVTDFEQLEPEEQIYVAMQIMAHFDVDFCWDTAADDLYGEHYLHCMDALDIEIKERLLNNFMEVVDD